MKYKVFVDGRSGTTGLKIDSYLKARGDIELLAIETRLKHDPKERRRLINSADIAIFCLPDAAADESLNLLENPKTRVIDTSSVHRTFPGFVYGFPELDRGQAEKIKSARLVSVPGCHATGFTAAVHPLTAGGMIPSDLPLYCQSVSGYSGGGKKLISQYESSRADDVILKSPRYYSLSLNHKHLPEMMKVNGLSVPPLFTPIVGPYYQGMLVTVPLRLDCLSKKINALELREYYKEYYSGAKFIKVMPFGGENALDAGYLDACGCNGTNRLELFVFGNDEQALIISRLDNLGKGASGAAVQCLNIMTGAQEDTGLAQ